MPGKVSGVTKKVTTQTKKTSTSSSRSGTTSRTTQAKASNPKSSSTVKQSQNVDRFVRSTPKPNPGTYSRPVSSNPGVRREREQAEQKQKAREAQLSNPMSHNVALRKEATRGEHDDKISRAADKQIKAEKFATSGGGKTVATVLNVSSKVAVAIATRKLPAKPSVKIATNIIVSEAKSEYDKNQTRQGEMTSTEKIVYGTTLACDSTLEDLEFMHENKKEIEEAKEAKRKLEELQETENQD